MSFGKSRDEILLIFTLLIYVSRRGFSEWDRNGRCKLRLNKKEDPGGYVV